MLSDIEVIAVKKHVKPIFQEENRDCGPACMAMILDYYGRRIPLSLLRDECSSDSEGTTLRGIVEAAENNGLETLAVAGDSKAVVAAFESGDVVLPAIARVRNREGCDHYTVVESANRDVLSIVDPDPIVGRARISYDDFARIYLGQIIVLAPSRTFQQVDLIKGRGVLIRFFPLVKAEFKLLFLTLLLSLLADCAGLATSLSFQWLIDSLVSIPNNAEIVRVSFLALVLAYVGRTVGVISRTWLSCEFARRVDMGLMSEVSGKLLSMPQRFFDSRSTGDLLARLSDSSKVRDALLGVVTAVLTDSLALILATICMASISPHSALVSIAAVFVDVAVVLAFSDLSERAQMEVAHGESLFTSSVKQSLDASLNLRCLPGAVDQAKREAADYLGKVTHSACKATRVASLRDSIVGLTQGLGLVMVITVAAKEAAIGTISVGSIVALSTIMGYILDPAENLVRFFGSTYKGAKVSANRLEDVLDATPEDEKGGLMLNEHFRTLDVNHVRFTYGARKPAINGVSLSVSSDEWIAVVGQSGCGKSTLAKLMVGLYQPDSGRIKVNGRSLNEISLAWLRKTVIYLPQHPLFVSGTIESNLLAGVDEDVTVDLDEIKRCLDAACCDFVKTPYDYIEESASNYSGGQIQRLSIARGVLRARLSGGPVCLVLDEATSSLNKEASIIVLEGMIEAIPKGSSIIMITHQEELIDSCDRVIRFDDLGTL